MQPFNFSAQIYVEPKNITIDPRCNNITAVNKGTTIIDFNGIPLSANESITVGGNAGEILQGKVSISFSGTGTSKAVIIQKYYL